MSIQLSFLGATDTVTGSRYRVDTAAARVIAPRRVFVTHGEASAADAFRRRMVDTFGWNATTPDDGAKIVLE
jgi:hypothetical protein